MTYSHFLEDTLYSWEGRCVHVFRVGRVSHEHWRGSEPWTFPFGNKRCWTTLRLGVEGPAGFDTSVLWVPSLFSRPGCPGQGTHTLLLPGSGKQSVGAEPVWTLCLGRCHPSRATLEDWPGLPGPGPLAPLCPGPVGAGEQSLAQLPLQIVAGQCVSPYPLPLLQGSNTLPL